MVCDFSMPKEIVNKNCFFKIFSKGAVLFVLEFIQENQK
jgi:hypothetical protein